MPVADHANPIDATVVPPSFSGSITGRPRALVVPLGVANRHRRAGCARLPLFVGARLGVVNTWPSTASSAYERAFVSTHGWADPARTRRTPTWTKPQLSGPAGPVGRSERAFGNRKVQVRALPPERGPRVSIDGLCGRVRGNTIRRDLLHVAPGGPRGPARDVRTVGVEEEFLLIGADGLTAAVAPRVLGPDEGDALTAQADGEVWRRAEPGAARDRFGTAHVAVSACGSRWSSSRRAAAEAAQAEGVALAATATSPVPAEPTVTAKGRYQRMRAEFGLTAREQLDLRMPCPCRGLLALGGDRRARPGEARPGAADRAERELAVLARRGHRLRQLPHPDLAALAHRRRDRRVRHAGVLRPGGRRPDRQRRGARRGDDLLRRPAVPPLPDAGAAGGRRLPVGVDDAVLVAALGRALVRPRRRSDGRPAEAVPRRPSPSSYAAASWRAARATASSGPLLDVERAELVAPRVPPWWTDWWNGSRPAARDGW